MVYDHVDMDIDNAMTAWSYKNERARVVVNRVAPRRIDYMKGLFVDAGLSPEKAELRARLMQSFVHGDRFFPDVCEPRNSKERARFLETFVELICAPAN